MSMTRRTRSYRRENSCRRDPSDTCSAHSLARCQLGLLGGLSLFFFLFSFLSFSPPSPIFLLGIFRIHSSRGGNKRKQRDGTKERRRKEGRKDVHNCRGRAFLTSSSDHATSSCRRRGDASNASLSERISGKFRHPKLTWSRN